MHSFSLDNNLVLIAPDGERLIVLNSTARKIWENNAEGMNKIQISQRMSAESGIDGAAILQDVEAMLGQWRSEGLLDQDGRIIECTRPKSNTASNPVESDFDMASNEDVFIERSYRLCKVSILLRISSQNIDEMVHPLFAHLSAEAEDGRQFIFNLYGNEGVGYTLSRNGVPIDRGMDRDCFVLTLRAEIFRLIENGGDYLTVLHAAAVGTGRECVVMPGAEGSGKSTLTAVLAHSGLVYLGDDVIPLERKDISAIPVPMCLNLKQGSLGVLRAYYPDIDRLSGFRRLSQTLRFLPPPRFMQNTPQEKYTVKMLVFPRYLSGSNTELVQISSTEALQRLVESESLLGNPLDPDKIGSLLAWLPTIPAYRLSYSCVSEAANCIMELTN